MNRRDNLSHIEQTYKEIIVELDRAQLEENEDKIYQCLERLKKLEREESQYFRGKGSRGLVIAQFILNRHGGVELQVEMDLLISSPSSQGES